MMENEIACEAPRVKSESRNSSVLLIEPNQQCNNHRMKKRNLSTKSLTDQDLKIFRIRTFHCRAVERKKLVSLRTECQWANHRKYPNQHQRRTFWSEAKTQRHQETLVCKINFKAFQKKLQVPIHTPLLNCKSKCLLFKVPRSR